MKSLGMKFSLSEVFSGALLLFTLRKHKVEFKPEHEIIPDAVIGIVDIVASTAICNNIDIVSSFKMKQSFQKIAAKRAFENNMVILNDTGDGFLFLANPNEGSEWVPNLAAFYFSLTEDFKSLMVNVNSTSGNDLESGLRFGVASGSVIIGDLGDSGQMMVVGPTVNLAARLCSRAGINQIVFSSQVWEHMRSVLPQWISKSRLHRNLKGFKKSILAAHAIGFPKRDTGTQMSVAV